MNKNIYKISTYTHTIFMYMFVCMNNYFKLIYFLLCLCFKNAKISLISANNDLSILGTADISDEQEYIQDMNRHI